MGPNQKEQTNANTDAKPIKIGRREFVIGGSLALGAAMAAACKGKYTLTSPVTASATPEANNTPGATATSTEPAPTQPPEAEPIHVGGVEITEKRLGTYQQMSGGSDLNQSLNYASQIWNTEITAEQLINAVIALQYVCALGTFKGEEGLIYPAQYLGNTTPPPGKEAEWRIMQNLAFYLLTLNNLPSEAEQLETKGLTQPENILINKGAQFTLVGQLVNEEILAVITDCTQDGARSYFVRIPNHFPDDPENTSKVSLRNLLQRSGVDYDPQTKEIVLPLEKGTYRINDIIGQQLNEQLKQATGIYFVNKMRDELIDNPVVPYPDKMLTDWGIAEETDADGEVSVVLTGKDGSGKETQLRATYDHESAKWTWAEMATSPEQELLNAPTVAGLEAYLDGDTVRYKAEADNPYGLEAGQYAGYLFNFNDETGISSGKGIALAVEVRRVLLEQANTLAAIEKGEWRMAMSFDPQGAEISIRRAGTYSLAISGLLPNTNFRSPFIGTGLATLFPNDGFSDVGINLPEELLSESKKGINYSFDHIFTSARIITVDNYSKKEVHLDDLLFADIGEEYLPDRFPTNSQVILVISSLQGSFDLSIDRFLMIDRSIVFALEK